MPVTAAEYIRPKKRCKHKAGKREREAREMNETRELIPEIFRVFRLVRVLRVLQGSDPEQISQIIGVELISREDLVELGRAQMGLGYFREDVAEIGGQCQIAALVELIDLQARPFAVDPAAADGAAQHKHDARMAMIRAAIAVLF